MNILKKGLIAGLFAICLLAAGNVKAEAAGVQEELVEARVAVPKETVMANVARVVAGSNGEVDGDGVRLRKKASSTAQILELMYDGEAVKVLISEAVIKNGTTWYYLQRLKTGTWGYANGNFIIRY